MRTEYFHLAVAAIAGAAAGGSLLAALQHCNLSRTCSGKPVLTYFNARGRAELSRLILKEAGVDFTDVRIASLDDLKKQGKLAFDQVPLLEVDGFQMVQSISIGRYLARKYGLYGNSAQEAALADMVVDGVLDLATHRRNAKTDEEKNSFEKEILPKWLGFFENLLKKQQAANGPGSKLFFVGNHLTYADLAVFNSLWNIQVAIANCLDKFQLLAEFKAQIEARPKIAKWLKERPATAM